MKYHVVAFMKNGNAVSYQVDQVEWELAQSTALSYNYLQFKTVKNSWVRLNLRELIALEFQTESPIMAVVPGKPN